MIPVPVSHEAAIELPFVDAAPGHRFAASMGQALALGYDLDRLGTLGLYEASHAVLPESPAIGVGLALDYAFAFFVTPPTVLMHEEWHRSALREGGVTGTNAFLTGEVLDVSDAELRGFKATDPAGFVRAQSAGLESQNALVRRIGDEAFLRGAEGFAVGPVDLMGTWMAPHAQFLEVNTWNYLRYCGSGDTDRTIPEVEAQEGGELERDFTGPDCTAWVRDLRRPDEPFDARGPHASGDGIGRYVAHGDLTAEEQAMLRQQTALHWLDLANPHLFGVDRVWLGDRAVTASLMHWLTPWGHALDLHGGVRGRRPGPAVLATLRLGVSEVPAYPAVEVRAVELPVARAITIDAGLEAWLQPEDQRFGGRPTPGGRLSARGTVRAEDRLSAWLGFDAKSAGWTVGLASLRPAVYGQAGATAWLGRPSRAR